MASDQFLLHIHLRISSSNGWHAVVRLFLSLDIFTTPLFFNAYRCSLSRTLGCHYMVHFTAHSAAKFILSIRCCFLLFGSVRFVFSILCVYARVVFVLVFA